jgi:hypothetical protein
VSDDACCLLPFGASKNETELYATQPDPATGGEVPRRKCDKAGKTSAENLRLAESATAAGLNE